MKRVADAKILKAVWGPLQYQGYPVTTLTSNSWSSRIEGPVSSIQGKELSQQVTQNYQNKA